MPAGGPYSLPKDQEIHAYIHNPRKATVFDMMTSDQRTRKQGYEERRKQKGTCAGFSRSRVSLRVRAPRRLGVMMHFRQMATFPPRQMSALRSHRPASRCKRLVEREEEKDRHSCVERGCARVARKKTFGSRMEATSKLFTAAAAVVVMVVKEKTDMKRDTRCLLEMRILSEILLSQEPSVNFLPHTFARNSIYRQMGGREYFPVWVPGLRPTHYTVCPRKRLLD